MFRLKELCISLSVYHYPLRSCDLSLSSSVASSPLVQSRRCARVNTSTSTSQLDLSTSSPVIAAGGEENISTVIN